MSHRVNLTFSDVEFDRLSSEAALVPVSTYIKHLVFKKRSSSGWDEILKEVPDLEKRLADFKRQVDDVAPKQYVRIFMQRLHI